MSIRVAVGTEVPPAVPSRASSVEEALGRVAGRPAVIESLVVGRDVQAHRSGDVVTLFGTALDPEAVIAAVLLVAATTVVVDVVAGEGGVRIVDILELDGDELAERPYAERISRLAEVAPVEFMVERTSLDVPAWAGAFAEHVRQRGVPGVWVRLLDAPRPVGDAGDAWQVVMWE